MSMQDSSAKKRKFEGDADVHSAPHEGAPIDPEAAAQEIAIYEQKIRRFIAPMTREQLCDLLITNGARYQPVFDDIVRVAESDPSQKKLFVRGLPFEATDADLHAVFAEHGPITEAVVIMDRSTGKSKGFGFVTYDSIEGAQLALEQPSKTILGRSTQCNLASAGKQDSHSSAPPTHSRPPHDMGGGMAGGPPAAVAPMGNDLDARKLFVRGLDWGTTEDSLHHAFVVHGDIEEAVVVTDKSTGRSKGFGFVIFRNAVDAAAALRNPQKDLDGRTIRFNLASEGNQRRSQHQPQHHGGMGGMGGMGMGGMGGMGMGGMGAMGGMGGMGAMGGMGMGGMGAMGGMAPGMDMNAVGMQYYNMYGAAPQQGYDPAMLGGAEGMPPQGR